MIALLGALYRGVSAGGGLEPSALLSLGLAEGTTLDSCCSGT